jgi:F-type H+-transporting ATPase subunit b
MLNKIILTAFLVSLSSIATAAEGGSLFSTDMLFKVINFVILLAILHKVARKPLVNMLSSTAMTEKEKAENAQKSLAEAERRLEEYTAKIARLEEEMEKRQQDAFQSITEEKKTLLADAEKFARNLEQKTVQRIEQDVHLARNEIQEYLVQESVKMAEKLAVESIDDTTQKSLIENYTQVLERTA